MKIDRDSKCDEMRDRVINEMTNNRDKILDEFFKAYLASRWDDYFVKQKKIDLKRVEVVVQMKSLTEMVYWFRLKKGKLKI